MPQLTVYIDEGGDPGVRDGLHYAETRHEWMTVSAVVVPTNTEPQTVEWVRELREIANAWQSDQLHYAKITPERRLPVAKHLATKPLRAFCIASHKTNVREYCNPALGAFNSQEFYNWCIRLLLERVTMFAAAWHKQRQKAPERLEVVFARRGGHNYRKMFGYIDILASQKANGGMKLRTPGLNAPFLDRTDWSVVPAQSLAGLQLADAIASAIWSGANTTSPHFDPEPAIALRQVMASRKGRHVDYGVSVWPLAHQAPLPIESRQLFESYGYGF